MVRSKLHESDADCRFLYASPAILMHHMYSPIQTKIYVFMATLRIQGQTPICCMEEGLVTTFIVQVLLHL